MTISALANVLGVIGVMIVLVAYYRLQTGRMDIAGFSFSAMNAAGSGLILVSLYFNFNLASFLIEAAWTSISLLGVYKSIKSRSLWRSK